MRTLAVPLALVALTACGSVHPAGSAEVQPIPWLPLAANLTPAPIPSPQPYPVPPGTPACTARGLVALEANSQGATGHVIVPIVFSGSGAAACFLDGTPHVVLLDSRGHDIAFAQRPPYFPAEVPGPALVEPGPPPDPHTGFKVGQASLTIDWDSQPELCPGDAPALVAGARIDIPGGGAITTQITSVPAAYACQGVGVSSFEGLPMPVETSPPPALPEAVLHAANSAIAGQRFAYTVTLTNATRVPIDLVANCPNYFEGLMTDDGLSVTGKQIYRLNCGPAGTLKAGQTATFEIELDVPAAVPHGQYRLLFLLSLSNAFGKPQAPPVQVAVS